LDKTLLAIILFVAISTPVIAYANLGISVKPSDASSDIIDLYNNAGTLYGWMDSNGMIHLFTSANHFATSPTSGGGPFCLVNQSMACGTGGTSISINGNSRSSFINVANLTGTNTYNGHSQTFPSGSGTLADTNSTMSGIFTGTCTTCASLSTNNQFTASNNFTKGLINTMAGHDLVMGKYNGFYIVQNGTTHQTVLNSTDANATINSAMLLLRNSTNPTCNNTICGGKLELKSGYYPVNLRVPFPFIVIEGASDQSSILQRDGNNPIIVLQGNSLYPIHDDIFNNLKIDGGNSATYTTNCVQSNQTARQWWINVNMYYCDYSNGYYEEASYDNHWWGGYNFNNGNNSTYKAQWYFKGNSGASANHEDIISIFDYNDIGNDIISNGYSSATPNYAIRVLDSKMESHNYNNAHINFTSNTNLSTISGSYLESANQYNVFLCSTCHDDVIIGGNMHTNAPGVAGQVQATQYNVYNSGTDNKIIGVTMAGATGTLGDIFIDTTASRTELIANNLSTTGVSGMVQVAGTLSNVINYIDAKKGDLLAGFLNVTATGKTITSTVNPLDFTTNRTAPEWRFLATNGTFGGVLDISTLTTDCCGHAKATGFYTGRLAFGGYVNGVPTNQTNPIGISGAATQTWTNSAMGAGLFLWTTANGQSGAVQTLRLDSTHDVGINCNNNLILNYMKAGASVAGTDEFTTPCNTDQIIEKIAGTITTNATSSVFKISPGGTLVATINGTNSTIALSTGTKLTGRPTSSTASLNLGTQTSIQTSPRQGDIAINGSSLYFQDNSNNTESVITSKNTQTMTGTKYMTNLVIAGTVAGGAFDYNNIGNLNMSAGGTVYKQLRWGSVNLQQKFNGAGGELDLIPTYAGQPVQFTLRPVALPSASNSSQITLLSTSSGGIGSAMTMQESTGSGAVIGQVYLGAPATPRGMAFNINGTTQASISAGGGWFFTPTAGQVSMNGTVSSVNTTPTLKVIIHNSTDSRRLLSAEIFIAHSNANVWQGYGVGTDWAVAGKNLTQTTIGGLNFACENSACSKGTFEVNDGNAASGVVRFGIQDNGSALISSGAPLVLDAIQGNQSGKNISTPHMAFLNYTSKSRGLALVSGGKIMEAMNGTNGNIDFRGTTSNAFFLNKTINMPEGGFDISLSAQKMYHNMTAIFPNSTNINSYVSYRDVMNATAINMANKTGTTSTSQVMLGDFATFTPAVTGNVRVTVSGDMASTVVGGGCRGEIRYNNGYMGLNGVAAIGTQVGSNINMNEPVVNQAIPFAKTVIITGLQHNNIKHFIDLSFGTINSGTCTISNVDWTLEEIS
jgi:hypothetical protein